MKLHKPYLRIQKQGERHYLSVCVLTGEGAKFKTLKSFGNAEKRENWTNAISYLLDAFADAYTELSEKYVK